MGNAPHLDSKARARDGGNIAWALTERVAASQYAVFGRLVSGDDILAAMEKVETRREGIFVMPLKRIEIVSSYVYSTADAGRGGEVARQPRCASALLECSARLKGLQADLQAARQARLPGR